MPHEDFAQTNYEKKQSLLSTFCLVFLMKFSNALKVPKLFIMSMLRKLISYVNDKDFDRFIFGIYVYFWTGDG